MYVEVKVLWKPGRSLEEDRENQVLHMYIQIR